jgi:type IV secretory pathway TrbD component
MRNIHQGGVWLAGLLFWAVALTVFVFLARLL